MYISPIYLPNRQNYLSFLTDALLYNIRLWKIIFKHSFLCETTLTTTTKKRCFHILTNGLNKLYYKVGGVMSFTNDILLVILFVFKLMIDT